MNELNTESEQLPVQPNVPTKEPELYQPVNQTVGQSTYEGYDLTAREKMAEESKPEGSDTQTVDWEASEYVHHDKGITWIVGLVIAAALLLGVAIFLKIWTFAFLIIVMAIAIGVFAFRPPRVLHYTLDGEGLHIDNHFYSFADFRAFGILSEGAFYTIMLIPSKRFMPAVNIYFAEQDGEKIVDILGVRLPMEHLRIDFIDNLMRRLRF